MGALQQDLVPPTRVTSTDADKLWHELHFHPDQSQEDYVIWGLTNGSHLDLNPLAVCYDMQIIICLLHHFSIQ